MCSSLISDDSDKELELDPPKRCAASAMTSVTPSPPLLTQQDLFEIDPHRARFLRQVDELVARRQRIAHDLHLDSQQRQHQLLNVRQLPGGVALDQLALTFTYAPGSRAYGYQQTELVPGGDAIDVTLDNVQRYAELTRAWCLDAGIRRQMDALYDGFSRVFPLEKLRAFSSDELRVMLCGEQRPEWTRDDLLAYTEPKLGYTKDSPGFQRFVNVLLAMDAHERKAFLQFTTGCSSLPPGGLANLYPRLTVVRKIDAGIGSYPSVNTCVHYLKLPDYPSEQILRQRLLDATREKGFHLN